MRKSKTKKENRMPVLKWALFMQWKEGRGGLIVKIINYMRGALDSLVMVIVPGLMIDMLTQQNHRDFFWILTGFVAWRFIDASLLSFTESATDVQDDIFTNSLQTHLVEKQTSLSCGQMEDPCILEEYEVAQRCVKENRISKYLSDIISIICTAVELFGLLYIIRSMPWYLLILFVAVTIVNAVVNRIASKWARKEMEENSSAVRQMRYYSYELIKPEYAKEMRLFNMSELTLKKHWNSIDTIFELHRVYDLKNGRSLSYSMVASKVLLVSFYVYNIISFINGNITAGGFTRNVSAMIAFSSLAGRILGSAVDMSAQAGMLAKVKSFLEQASVCHGDKTVEKPGNDSVFEFKHVFFRYPGTETDALKDINIKIRAGEKTAVVGRNGAGKSTFLCLLAGLYQPTSGLITYNGIPIEEYNPEQYRALFSALFQDYSVYHFTVKDNVLLSEINKDIDNEKTYDALKKAGLLDKVISLPKKEHTYLSKTFDEEGVMLSGGEKQKLAMARVFYQDKDILLLDEPSAALSPTAEYELYKSFRQNTEGKTVFFVSHRLASCSLCERILVFDDGKIIEDGSHEKLIRDSSVYADMFKKQAEFFCENEKDGPDNAMEVGCL